MEKIEGIIEKNKLSSMNKDPLLREAYKMYDKLVEQKHLGQAIENKDKEIGQLNKLLEEQGKKLLEKNKIINETKGDTVQNLKKENQKLRELNSKTVSLDQHNAQIARLSKDRDEAYDVAFQYAEAFEQSLKQMQVNLDINVARLDLLEPRRPRKLTEDEKVERRANQLLQEHLEKEKNKQKENPDNNKKDPAGKGPIVAEEDKKQ